MTKETGTLAELNVKPRDVVECVELGIPGNSHYVTVGKQYAIQPDGRFIDDEGDLCRGHSNMFRIVSRATPKAWGEITDAEKGAILLADCCGEVVEWRDPGDINDDWDTKSLRFGCPDMAYRVRPPEPKRETVTIYGAPSKHIQWCLDQCGLDTHRITFDVIDGNPDCASIRMEEL